MKPNIMQNDISNITRSKKYQPGMKFNMLTLLEPTIERRNSSVVWKCKCECGNIAYITARNLRTTKSCGCLRHKNKLDIKPGDVFGKLTVVEEIPERDSTRRIHYRCKCECGNISTPSGSDLKSGNSTSCGKCSPFWNYIKYTDLTNQKFGKLTALKPITDKEDECYKNQSGRSMFWLCHCECGNDIKISANHLTQGRSRSCGCMLGKESIGEQQIKKILKDNHILFKTEISFNDLKQTNKLRYDFGIFDNKGNLLRLIEFDGEQHYEEQSFFKQTLTDIKNNDIIKNKYAKENNIPLVRIPYWERDKMTLEMLLGKEYLIE